MCLSQKPDQDPPKNGSRGGSKSLVNLSLSQNLIFIRNFGEIEIFLYNLFTLIIGTYYSALYIYLYQHFNFHFTTYECI